MEATVDMKSLQEATRKAPLRLYQELRRAVYVHHSRHYAQFRRARFHASRGGSGVQTRSGHLKDGFHVETSGHDLDSLEVRTFSAGVPYARIQELGGTVVPRQRQWLTIPLDEAKTPGGQTRAPARAWTDTFFLPIAGERLLLMQRREGGAVPLFLLVKRSTLLPRLGFRLTWDAMRGELAAGVNAAVGKALAAAGGPSIGGLSMPDRGAA
jgi:hypothetical protein